MTDLIDKSDKALPTAHPEKRTNERTETHARDCISRQEAIDALNGQISVTGDINAKAVQNYIRMVNQRLHDLPSAQPYTEAEIQKMQDIEQAELQAAYEQGKQDAQSEPQWIPCSERLPDEYEYVLLCDREPDEDTGYARMAVGWLEDGKICCWDDRATREEFVAWMPLPEPYKEEQK